MGTFLRRTNRALSAVISEKRLYVQAGDSTSYLRLSPVAQLLTGTTGLALAGWMAVATSMVALDRLSSGAEVQQTLVLRDAYEARLEELASERDQRAGEAQSAQARFQIAMDQISRQQTAILASVEERRELSVALDLMRARLQDAVGQRDEIAEANDRLLGQMSAVNESLSRNRGDGQDLSETLDAVSGALAEAVVDRDTATAERSDLERQLGDLELQMRISEKRHEDMLDQIEQAVAMSFGPLQQMFENSEVDVEQVIATVRRTHSGAGGGPLGATTMSTRSYDDGTMGSRLDEVMINLDRMNLLRIAASKIPYAVPVRDSFRFTSGFGYRRDPKGAGHRMHSGVDFAAGLGTPIFATADGVVESAKTESGYGRTVRLLHDFGFETVYAHQTKLLVEPGQKVSRGEQIGAMGSTGRSTGVHLHYEVHLNGRPVNPMIYLEAAKDVF
jgi:murein DD-endopeptidase MepM/ murein hydrolase activator NlpD